MSSSLVDVLAEVDGSNSAGTKSSCIFYKLIVASILLHNKLRIPNKFVKRYQNELSSTALLSVSDGRTWPVGLTKADDKLWFSNGWLDFIDHYSISAGYFLVFKYEGKSNFQTYAFDLTVSEIRYPFSIGTEELDNDKKYSAPTLSENKFADSRIETRDIGIQCNCNDILGTEDTFQMQLPDRVEQSTKRKNEQVSLGNVKDVCAKTTHLKDPTQEMQLPDCVEQNTKRKSQDSGIYEQVSLGNMKDVSAKTTHLKDPTQEMQLPPDRVKQNTKRKSQDGGIYEQVSLGNVKDVCAKTTHLKDPTQEKKEKAFAAAQMFKSDNPFFRIVLSPTCISGRGTLSIPLNFSRKHLAGTIPEHVILEDSSERQWTIRYSRCNDDRLKLAKEWLTFARDNKLMEGDVCVFELIDINKLILRVTIFRVHIENKLLVHSRIVSRDIGLKYNCNEILGTEDTFGMQSPGAVEQNTKRKRHANGYYKQVQLGKEKAKAVVGAQMFKSDNPFFRIVLQPFFVARNGSMNLPSDFVRKHLSGTIPEHAILELSSGGEWLVVCSGNGGRLKFGKGWAIFTRDNKLMEGDVCFFELVDADKLILRVTTFPSNP